MAKKITVTITGSGTHNYNILADLISERICGGEHGIDHNEIAIYLIRSERDFSPLKIEWIGRQEELPHLSVKELNEELRNLVYTPGFHEYDHSKNNVLVIGRLGREEHWLGIE